MKSLLTVWTGCFLLALRASATVLYVDLACTNATPPFTNWPTAATNIQDAVDASMDGDTVLVTNGVYASGGRVMYGNLTNRVALNKAIIVQSINGPLVTIIKGAGATNGPSAVRCAWLTNEATLNGFTLTGGATTTTAGNANLSSGGGVWCSSTTNCFVMNCIIVSNTAYFGGGGTWWGALRNCAIIWNSTANAGGGGALGGKIVNCTIVGNTGSVAAGEQDGNLTNCIVYFNGENIDVCKKQSSRSGNEQLFSWCDYPLHGD